MSLRSIKRGALLIGLEIGVNKFDKAIEILCCYLNDS